MKKLFFLLWIVAWSMILPHTLHAAPDGQTSNGKPYTDSQKQTDNLQQKFDIIELLPGPSEPPKPKEDKRDTDPKGPQEAQDETEDCDC